MNRIILLILIGISMNSCGDRKIKINYNNKIDTTTVINDLQEDTTKVLVSELPVKFNGTDNLIFAVGLIDLHDRGHYSKIGSGSHSDSEVGIGYFDRDYLTGNFINLVFEDKNGNQNKLTEDIIRIRNVIFLRDIFNITRKAYLLYTITDRDTNGDKQLDFSDLESLYISNIDGTGFVKISKELNELYDYKIISTDNRIYFRTLEDINKDGELNNQDKFHYYYIKFDSGNYLTVEYYPLKLFK